MALPHPPAAPSSHPVARVVMLVGITGLALPAPADAKVAQDRATLEARVAAVRQSLAASPGPQAAWPAATLWAQAAQWNNWPKWGKWSNWANQ